MCSIADVVSDSLCSSQCIGREQSSRYRYDRRGRSSLDSCGSKLTVRKSASIVLHIQHEMGLHLEYCKSFGLEKAEIERQKESIGQLNPPFTLRF